MQKYVFFTRLRAQFVDCRTNSAGFKPTTTDDDGEWNGIEHGLNVITQRLVAGSGQSCTIDDRPVVQHMRLSEYVTDKPGAANRINYCDTTTTQRTPTLNQPRVHIIHHLPCSVVQFCLLGLLTIRLDHIRLWGYWNATSRVCTIFSKFIRFFP